MSGNREEIGYNSSGNHPFFDMETDLTKHWLQAYHWGNRSKRQWADYYKCTAHDVEMTMAAIEQAHPKPKQTNGGHCRSCGAEVVVMNGHTCDPAVVKGIDFAGRATSIRQEHRCGV